MKSFKSLIVPITAAFSILLSGCAYTTTSNTFSYHGTDLQNTSEPFSYVEKNIVGYAETAYTWKGGGNTRNGLIADAFENLNNQFKLDVNQALANVAIDILQIESGFRTPLLLALFSGVSYFPSDFTKIVNVRADVIEFGSAIPSKSITWSEKALIKSTNTSNNTSVEANEKSESNKLASMSVGGVLGEGSSSSRGKIAESQFKEGQLVVIEFGGNPRGATILEYSWDSTTSKYNYKCEYKTNSDNIRTTWRLEDEIEMAE